jgi:hypothetical protein
VADDGNGIYAAARIQYSGSVAKNGGTGNVTSSDANWTPPPCWYVPYLGAKNCKKKMSKDLESQLNTPGMGGHADDSIGEPYAKGKADETQPCGVKYLRSSGDDTSSPGHHHVGDHLDRYRRRRRRPPERHLRQRTSPSRKSSPSTAESQAFSTDPPDRPEK